MCINNINILGVQDHSDKMTLINYLKRIFLFLAVEFVARGHFGEIQTT